MKKNYILLALLLLAGVLKAQVSYLAVTNHNNGSGSNNLFNGYVSTGQNCYIDWDVWAIGLNAGDPCGTKTISRLILRRKADNDPFSVVASAPIIVNGTCNGKNGNNDKYFANISGAINTTGRYSVEIQADLTGVPNSYDNATAATTFNYMCPPAYYLTGASGSTGLYYTPPGTCSFGGKSDPIGGANQDKLNEINTALKFFTVGEAGNYRDMVVFNNIYYDLNNGKFQPGNPRVPSTLNGISPIPLAGICALIPAPVLPMGAEVNIFKRTNCAADITGANMFYRVYKSGNPAPSFSSFSIAYRDACTAGGPESNTFTGGGSCQNLNNILDQRWQTATGPANILPASFTGADAGTWLIEFYTETYIKDCAGIASIQTSTVNNTSFTVLDPAAPGSPCGALAANLLYFNARKEPGQNILSWTVGAGNDLIKYEIEKSSNGVSFSKTGEVTNINARYNYSFADVIVANTSFYRLKMISSNGIFQYSNIIKLTNEMGLPKLQISKNGFELSARLDGVEKGIYQLQVIDLSGKQLVNEKITVQNNGNSLFRFTSNALVNNAVYFGIIRSADGRMVANVNFW